MNERAGPIGDILPHQAPGNDGARLLLHGIRRMGVGGLNDAHVANAMIGVFGLSFRRPLVLMRAMMAELSRASTQSIIIAPSCCVRMTGSEALLVSAVAGANESPAATHNLLCSICGVASCLGLLSSAQAVSQAFADLGHPIEIV